ncbi:ATP-dependent Clp protease ATP-binding subunit ClpX [Striga asiatica]|uniref:ATP-dependent Clp protease ATP-binding subunit ClpX n=1 Tax=Striga asiatica TaxID=4170 RepID=A0A5A7PTX3_STRAF|nr:ATP-dependent Clp protease ATP-binding subunit ClpX [Striga asiatica]
MENNRHRGVPSEFFDPMERTAKGVPPRGSSSTGNLEAGTTEGSKRVWLCRLEYGTLGFGRGRHFSAEDNKAILNLKDLDPSQEDKLHWMYEKTGFLSVASVYSKLIEKKWRNMDIVESSRNHIAEKAMRTRSWSLIVKEKIRHFTWRCVENLQAVLINLVEKNLASDPKSDGTTLDNLNFKGWWAKLCSIKKSPCANDRLNLTAYILSVIWKSRNLIYFQYT